MIEHVIDERPQADRILIAQLHGTAKRHAKWRELSESEHGAEVGRGPRFKSASSRLGPGQLDHAVWLSVQ